MWIPRFYKELKDYISFVMKKRMKEIYGIENAYDLVFPDKFEFMFDAEVIYIYGIPVKSTKYDNYVFTFELKKTLSTLPDKKPVKVYIDAEFFEKYVMSNESYMPHLNGKIVYINFH